MKLGMVNPYGIIHSFFTLTLCVSCIPEPPAETPKPKAAVNEGGAVVATLEGPVLRIDSKDAGNLPKPLGVTGGCHVVVTDVFNPMLGMSVDTQIKERAVFYFTFKVVAHHRYVIDTTDVADTRVTGFLRGRTLTEFDENGTRVRTFQWQKGSEAPPGC